MLQLGGIRYWVSRNSAGVSEKLYDWCFPSNRSFSQLVLQNILIASVKCHQQSSLDLMTRHEYVIPSRGRRAEYYGLERTLKETTASRTEFPSLSGDLAQIIDFLILNTDNCTSNILQAINDSVLRCANCVSI